MKISETCNSTNEIISMYKTNKGKVGSKYEDQAGDSVVQEDKVSLSSTARDIQLAEKAIENLPDIREEKIQALKDQIAAGKYNVSGEKIAEKMMRESFLDIMA